MFYLYSLLASLSDSNMATPKHRITITPTNVRSAKKMLGPLASIRTSTQARLNLGSHISGYLVSHQTVQFMKRYFEFVIEQWSLGQLFTEPTHIFAVNHINPLSINVFTKPFLVLINELDFSGADFFAAILQDNERARLFGAKTAGAGGYVLSYKNNSILGIEQYRLTGSIAERTNLTADPIENLGVTPDVAYEISIDDLQHNYRGYVKAVK